jgi:hypothetical protein
MFWHAACKLCGSLIKHACLLAACTREIYVVLYANAHSSTHELCGSLDCFTLYENNCLFYT